MTRSPLRVLHVCHEFPPETIGGISTQASDLVDGLRALGVHGAVATVPARTETPAPYPVARSDRLPYRPPREWTYPDLHLLLGDACRRAAEAMDFDVVHCHESKAFPAARDFCAGHGVPLVATAHSTEAGRRRGRLEADHVEQEHLRLQMVREASRAIAVSGVVRASLAGYGVPERAVTVVRNGVPDHGAALDRPARRGPSLCFVGRLELEKGADFIAPVVHSVQRALPSARVTVAGDGRLRPALEAWVRSECAPGTVELLGAVDHDRALSVIARSDVLVIPSRYDSYSLVMLEAASLGTPTVAFDVGGNSEFLEPGRSGILVPPDDVERLAGAVVALLSDPGERRRIGTGARERYLARGSAERMARETLRVYREAIHAHGARRRRAARAG